MLKDCFTILEVAKIYGIKKCSVYYAIKTKKISVIKEKGRLYVSNAEMMAYKLRRYSRSESRFEGELAFDKSKGEYSLPEAAKFLGVPRNVLYYQCKIKAIPFIRKNKAYVFQIEALRLFKRCLTIKSIISEKLRA